MNPQPIRFKMPLKTVITRPDVWSNDWDYPLDDNELAFNTEDYNPSVRSDHISVCIDDFGQDDYIYAVGEPMELEGVWQFELFLSFYHGPTIWIGSLVAEVILEPCRVEITWKQATFWAAGAILEKREDKNETK